MLGDSIRGLRRASTLLLAIVAACGSEPDDPAMGSSGTGPVLSSSSTAGAAATGPSTAIGSGEDTSSSTGSPSFELESSPSVIRVQVSWSPRSGYALGPVKGELSGTPALERRAQQVDALGSFVGVISDPATGEEVLQQSIGTGVSYRELTGSLTFRFPAFRQEATFTLFAPDPDTGELTEVLSESIEPESVGVLTPQRVQVTTLRSASLQPPLAVTVYAEGYLEGSEAAFLVIPVPDGVCTMSSGVEFCDVCAAAMREKLEADLAP